MATLQEFATRIVTDLPEMGRLFEGVVTQDPLSAVSAAMGALFVLAASGALAYLAFGGLLDLLGAGSTR
ncbi:MULTISPECIES: hypothetical protein [Halolamina]|uniref:Uncharacterized protein n=1 Tax=Halolamina pelagica TaxID=699431 RepID=A0A1I5V5T9_9EURY|nr:MULTISPECIES: hypothetical protein [Halolamina]NHX37901.1 hypothetical protein [Halolamina sp. R1-12]SFQ02752.1 hypothetical protein SAMN05216277_11631 [Halolamina pelagica]